MKEKVDFFKDTLEPVIEELSRRNPNPDLEEQVKLVQGTWTPIWSTIPFQDSLPGRVLDESYQIFRDNGFYANIARYAPGNQLKVGWGLRLASFLLALDLIVLQKYAINNNEWYIENVAIKQALRWSGRPLSIDAANEWVDGVLQTLPSESQQQDSGGFKLNNVDLRTKKKLDTAFQSKPTLEHLYIDNDFRIVKSRRAANMRASYTVAVRRGGPYEDRATMQVGAINYQETRPFTLRSSVAYNSYISRRLAVTPQRRYLRKLLPCGLRHQSR